MITGTSSMRYPTRRVAQAARDQTAKLLPGYRAKRKYGSELHHWRRALEKLQCWFVDGSLDWCGVPAPTTEQKLAVSELWSTNAILTLHKVRPIYLGKLCLGRDAFRGQRVLEVGCGPLAHLLQFDDCARHGLDPLLDRYLEAGWPLYDLDVNCVNAYGENMPYCDGYFDSVISVNALDHVDDFTKVAYEIQRVVKPGGRVFFQIEYHDPTVNEPQRLDDAIIRKSFPHMEMQKIREGGKRETLLALAEQFDLGTERVDDFTDDETFVTWYGTRH